jgi:hypothetical protein
MARVYIGDMINKAGIYTNPGVVTQKKEDGTIGVDTDPMALNKYHRYMNTTGLSENDKNTFNEILDQIYSSDDSDVQKINGIQNNIDELKVDPKKAKIVMYLRNQQAHLIRTTEKLPDSYTWDSQSLRQFKDEED